MIEDVQAGDRNEIGIGQKLKELGLEKGRIGIVGTGPSFFRPCTIPYEHYTHFLNEFPQAEFEDVTEWYEMIRSIKSPEEIVESRNIPMPARLRTENE